MTNLFQEVLDLQEAIKKGDFVHVGHMIPGGSGVSGKVEKIENDKVYIRHDNGNLYKGLLKNTTKLKPTKEEVELEEKKLTPAELKKREEIAKAIERDNPDIDMSKKMAIATAVAKRVAENSELEESDVFRMQGGRKMVSAAAFLKYANEEAKKRGLKKATPDLVKSLSQKHGINTKD